MRADHVQKGPHRVHDSYLQLQRQHSLTSGIQSSLKLLHADNSASSPDLEELRIASWSGEMCELSGGGNWDLGDFCSEALAECSSPFVWQTALEDFL